MSEIVLAEPIHFEQGESSTSRQQHHHHEYEYDYEYDNTMAITTNSVSSSSNGEQLQPGPFDSERLPTVFASEIQRFLRVANLLEREEPRVAYLCRVHAFVIAHNLDKNSSGRGVRQFKTSLLHRLEQDENATKRGGIGDIRELKRVYHVYRDYFARNNKAFDLEQSRREKLINARIIASVLFEVLKTVTNTPSNQALTEGNAIHKKTEFNILPLEQGGIQHAIMQQPEIKAAIAVIRNIRGLPPAQDFKKHGAFIDLFDFLQHCFGFQEANVANQREHLILLLANMQTRQTHHQTSVIKLGEGGVDELMRKFFKNYTTWCKFLERKSNIRLPFVKQEAQQYKILYIGLYLLIWGEAANLRFMPECLCYIFHHMSYEMHGVLSGAISLTTWEKVMPAYGNEPESFLNNVVTPIYNVLKKVLFNVSSFFFLWIFSSIKLSYLRTKGS
jgi:callose synthase